MFFPHQVSITHKAETFGGMHFDEQANETFNQTIARHGRRVDLHFATEEGEMHYF